jgi:hypothetical protein
MDDMSLRRYYIVDFNRITRNLKLFKEGILPINYRNESDFGQFTYDQLNGITYSLDTFNKQVRSDIHIFDAWVSMMYYEGKEIDEIPRIPTEDGVSRVAFDLINDLVTAGNRLIHRDFVSITANDIEIMFILHNSLDQLVVRLEEEYEIL